SGRSPSPRRPRRASRSARRRAPRAHAVRRRTSIARCCPPGRRLRQPLIQAMRKLIPFLIVFLITAVAGAAPASDRDDAAGVALAFYRVYAGGDVDAALSFWPPKSPAAEAMQRR